MFCENVKYVEMEFNNSVLITNWTKKALPERLACEQSCYLPLKVAYPSIKFNYKHNFSESRTVSNSCENQILFSMNNIKILYLFFIFLCIDCFHA